MTAYELAKNILDNAEDNTHIDITEAARLLKEFRYDDEAGELSGITAEDLAEEYNKICG